jgi:hypothetical protein
MAGTALDASGNEVRSTPVHHYPLPPSLPGRYEATFNGNNQYRLPDPETGELKSYSRATSIAKVLDDTYMLNQWRIRKVLLGVGTRMNLQADLMQAADCINSGDPDYGPDWERKTLNAIGEEAASAAGTDKASEHGSAVHDWAAWVDAGLISVHQVPEQFRYAVYKHLELLAGAQLLVVPEYTERIVMSSELNTVGTLDRVFLYRDRLVLGDLKTSGRLDFSWLSFAVQLAFYQSCDLMLSEDGKFWQDIPPLEDDVAMLVHLPSTDINNAQVVPIDLEFGRTALALAVHVRDIRSRAKKEAPATTALSPHPPLDRWFAARLAVQTSATPSDISQVWTEYQDVWTDDLTTLGLELVKAINAKGHVSR